MKAIASGLARIGQTRDKKIILERKTRERQSGRGSDGKSEIYLPACSQGYPLQLFTMTREIEVTESVYQTIDGHDCCKAVHSSPAGDGDSLSMYGNVN